MPWQEKHQVGFLGYSPFHAVGWHYLRPTSILKKIAAAHQVSPYQVMLAWITRHNNVVTLPKASSVTHAQDNIAAMDLQLTPIELQKIDQEYLAPTRKVPLDKIWVLWKWKIDMQISNVKLRQPYSSLDIYYSASDEALPAVVIIPGGSYNQIKERDSERVALTFATHAFQAFVVRYPVLVHKSYPAAKVAISQAFDYIVAHTTELQVNPSQLGVIGFSAGGQLAAAYGNQVGTKAKFVALGYPVIKPTIDDKMGVTTEDVSRLVTSQTPATFIWGSINDGLTPFVDYINAYAVALAKHKVLFELHEFGTGNHGIALANKYTGIVNRDRVDDHMAKWFPLFLDWLSRLF